MTLPHNETFRFLLERRSASVLSEPKPNRTEIEQILQLAGTVPDHGMLKPYRFVIVEGESREKFGEALIDAANTHRSEPLDDRTKPKIKAKAFAAPLQVLIVYSPIASDKIHDWEQYAAASCTGYAVVIGANSLGYGAVWKSFAYDPGEELKKFLGLSEHEKFLGWVNIGTEKDRDRSPRDALDLKKHATFLS